MNLEQQCWIKVEIYPDPDKYGPDPDKYDPDPAQMVLDQCRIKGRNAHFIGSGYTVMLWVDPDPDRYDPDQDKYEPDSAQMILNVGLKVG